jgi:hypothetical protein
LSPRGSVVAGWRNTAARGYCPQRLCLFKQWDKSRICCGKFAAASDRVRDLCIIQLEPFTRQDALWREFAMQRSLNRRDEGGRHTMKSLQLARVARLELLDSIKGAATRLFVNPADLGEFGKSVPKLLSDEVDLTVLKVHQASSLRIKC